MECHCLQHQGNDSPGREAGLTGPVFFMREAKKWNQWGTCAKQAENRGKNRSKLDKTNKSETKMMGKVKTGPHYEK
jgi:hypothetical protein